jgi:hypothetical protein
MVVLMDGIDWLIACYESLVCMIAILPRTSLMRNFITPNTGMSSWNGGRRGQAGGGDWAEPEPTRLRKSEQELEWLHSIPPVAWRSFPRAWK